VERSPNRDSNRRPGPAKAGTSRTKKVAALAVVALIVLVSILGYQYLTSPTKPSTHITIGLSDATNGYWPVYIAKDSGMFEKYGLNATVAILGGGRDVVISLAAGQIQIGGVGTDSVVAAKLEELDVVQIGATERERPFYLVTRPGIQSAEQLKGKVGGVINVGVGLTYVATATMLARLGLDPTKDVTLVGIAGGSAARLAAVQAGKIDFTLTSEVLRAKKLGLNVLFYVPEIIEGMPGNGYATSSKYLTQNREIVKRFIKAVTEATKFFFDNKEDSKEILGNWLKEKDPETLEQHYQDWSRVALKIPMNNLAQVRNVLDAIAPFAPKAANADPRIFVDNSIIEELEREGFFKSIWGQAMGTTSSSSVHFIQARV